MSVNKKLYTIHKTDVVLDGEKLKDIIDKKGMDYTELYETTKEQYGLDLTYKGFMSLLKNRSNWKLIYAWAIADVLKTNIADLFCMIDIDVDKAIKDKEKWKEKYQKQGVN